MLSRFGLWKQFRILEKYVAEESQTVSEVQGVATEKELQKFLMKTSFNLMAHLLRRYVYLLILLYGCRIYIL